MKGVGPKRMEVLRQAKAQGFVDDDPKNKRGRSINLICRLINLGLMCWQPTFTGDPANPIDYSAPAKYVLTEKGKEFVESSTPTGTATEEIGGRDG